MSWSSRLNLAPLLVAPFLLATAPTCANAQTARISEEVRTLQTYPFSEPNPIPILTRDPRLYPYHSFEGYAATPEPREWKVVHLENDYIEVFVLPEVGGKVWGAVVKETGHEFIYRNEVMKFRNIALRGPWTSGGIEFNFGVIGHTPATATPVDYILRENPDGSVSCWVGSMDLPSRTHWRVEIRLPADRAYFETNVLWYNPTPLGQPYYNWMTAAAFAQDDLEMSMPGDAYLQHSGNELPWPEDEQGRYLPLYRNNTFAGHKSYHVVGEVNDFFGGYYHGEDYGFGHWSRYEDMPGQKLWLWALSREGGVWEELLTDTDGQYVEFQAGRLFVQYSPGSEVNPITQAEFDPLSASRWTETWFPLEGIGGLTDASRDGAMHVSPALSSADSRSTAPARAARLSPGSLVSAETGRITVSVNAFRDITDTIRVWAGDRLLENIPVTLSTLEPFETTVEVPPGEPFRVQLPALGLDYESDPTNRRLARPFSTDPRAWAGIPEVDRTVSDARELLKGRRYGQARDLFEAALEKEPWNHGALLGLADLSLRSASYEAGLEHANRALQLDAYDADANFLAGTLSRALGRMADARDAFGWAARSTAYRSAAYVQLAEMMVQEEDFAEAARYAHFAIDFDRYSVSAWRALAVIGRKTGDGPLAEEAIRELLTLDPLHHFALAEEYLRAPAFGLSSVDAAAALANALGGEYPDQTFLELITEYVRLGLRDDALDLIRSDMGRRASSPPDRAGPAAGSGTLMISAWQAWLAQDPSLLPEGGDPAFAFPFRAETIPVLRWATQKSLDWIWTYLLALNLWAVDREEEAMPLLESLGRVPQFGPFHVVRAHLLSRLQGVDPTADLRRAVALDPENRTLHIHLILHFQERDRWEDALEALGEAQARFPGDFNLHLLHARALVHMKRAGEATRILATTQVLPSESAREIHKLYEQAHTLVALDAMESGDWAVAKEHLTAALQWPESLGQGRPYQPEERLVRFLLGRVEQWLGDESAAREAFQAVVEATGGPGRLAAGGPPIVAGMWRVPSDRLDLLTIPALQALGRAADIGSLAWASVDPADLADRLAMESPSFFDDLDGQPLLRALGQKE